MSDNYTYEPPNTERYLQALLKLLQANKENNLYKLLKKSKCVIDSSGSFSEKRWNAHYATIYFYISIKDLDLLNIDEESKERLKNYCDRIMPKDIGYDVMCIELSPNLNENADDQYSIESDLEEFSNLMGQTENFYIPEDVLKKGKEMMRVYFYLYAIENYIRLFIEKVSIRTYGNEFFYQLTITKNIKDTIAGRKRTEEKNRWVSIRGNSDLFYLDFIELSAIIQNNWEIFKCYFPDQAWISSKLSELYTIRNLVAHNSYVGEHEQSILHVNFRCIMMQLNNI